MSDDAEAAQSKVIESLCRRLAESTGAPVKRIDTQGAVVLLAGPDAYKIRRAIRLPFLDYSTLARRREATFAELALNRPAAPKIYLDATPIAENGETLAVGGEGKVVEWATHMRRFDEDGTLDKLAERGELSDALIAKLSCVLHQAHEHARACDAEPAIASLRTWIEQNHRAFAEHPDLFPPARAGAILQRSREKLEVVEPLLKQRGDEGFIRRCHGDLHLRNIVVIDGEPTPFDAIEFDDAIATGDVLYDLAFAVMDLWDRGFAHHANALVNGYLALGGEAHYAGLAALPLFLSVRAAIRAKVEAANRLHVEGEAREKIDAAARRYFDLAYACLEPHPPRLVAVGGLSGSGKSALARELAPQVGRAPGAVWLSSDIERKHGFGVDETEKLPDTAYSAAATRAVYEHIRRKAELALAAGQAAFIDATHARASDRLASVEIAEACGVKFFGLWLEAPLATRLERVAARHFDASDAGERVVRRQRAEPLAEPGWSAIDASGTLAQTAVFARSRLGLV
jgi:hypothetical protein